MKQVIAKRFVYSKKEVIACAITLAVLILILGGVLLWIVDGETWQYVLVVIFTLLISAILFFVPFWERKYQLSKKVDVIVVDEKRNALLVLNKNVCEFIPLKSIISIKIKNNDFMPLYFGLIPVPIFLFIPIKHTYGIVIIKFIEGDTKMSVKSDKVENAEEACTRINSILYKNQSLN